GIFSMLVAMSVGTLIGALAGFYGGWLDIVLMHLTDLCLASPTDCVKYCLQLICRYKSWLASVFYALFSIVYFSLG
ncbi:MAG: hypothetical protein V7K60_13100, partial [Nostoc sp.]